MLLIRLQKRPGIAVITPENVDDLWTIRRIVIPKDIISGHTKRVIKDKSEHARPGKGERIRVKLSIEVEKINLDHLLERIRISGKIVETSDESISKGAYHSFNLTIGNSIIIKKNYFEDFHINLIKNKIKSTDRCIIICIDRRQAGIGLITGTHLKLFSNIESGLAGKMYKTNTSYSNYFDKILKDIINIHTKGIKIIVTGPSEIKKEFVNYCIGKAKNLAEYITIIEGVDLGGQDGIFMSLKSPNFKNFLQKTELTKAILFTEEAINRISRGDKKVCFTFNDTLRASKMSSINVVMISSKIFEGRNENDVIELLNNIEKFKGRTFLLDSSTEIGKQIDSLGGVLALLRYQMDWVD